MSTERDETIVNEAEELELTEKLDDQDGDGKGADPEKGKGEGEEESDGEGEGGKRQRSKPAHQRIGELTAARREAERRAEAAEQRLREIEQGKGDKGGEGGDKDAGTELKEPNPDDFEFGEADPGYIRAMARYEVKLELAEAKKAEQRDSQVSEIRQTFADADTAWQEQAAKGPEKYADFNEVVLEGAAAEDWKCGPLATLGIANSEQGIDIAYHLASNPEESEELFALERSPNVADRMEFMRRFGMLEARFAVDGGVKGGGEGEPKPKAKIATDAPEPPRHTTRGGGGKFEVDDDTDDFAAFEAKVMKDKK